MGREMNAIGVERWMRRWREMNGEPEVKDVVRVRGFNWWWWCSLEVAAGFTEKQNCDGG